MVPAKAAPELGGPHIRDLDSETPVFEMAKQQAQVVDRSSHLLLIVDKPIRLKVRDCIVFLADISQHALQSIEIGATRLVERAMLRGKEQRAK